MDIVQSKRCVVLNRWDDDFAAYHRYIDHSRHHVAYVTTPKGRSSLCAHLAVHIEIVADLGDREAVVAATRRCLEKLGGLDRIVALSEFDLAMAGQLRAEFAVPGDLPEDVARFRDKTVMKQAVLAAGLRAPTFARLDDVDAVEQLLAQQGFPIMVKPRAGAASIGCHRIDSRADFDLLCKSLAAHEYECEEFIDGPIFHVDGLVAEGRPEFVKVSRYINTCYDFAQGKPLGSILLDQGERESALRAFAGECLGAIGLSDGAFHLEVIGADDGLCFLEVGARVGGGEIPFLMRDLFGLDFFEEWMRIEFGNGKAPVAARDEPGDSGGFLMLPEPVGKRLTARSNSLIGSISGLYGEVLPPVGHVFDGAGGYEVILGRFRYRGLDEAGTEAAIAQTLSAYRYTLQDTDIALPNKG